MASEDDQTASTASSSSRRFDLLKVAEVKSTEKWLKAQKLSDFTTHLPAAIAKDKKYLEVIHEKFNKEIVEGIGKAFASRYSDWELEDRLKELEALVTSAESAQTGSGEAWRPSGKAADDLAANVIGALSEGKESLDKNVLSEVNADISALFAEVKNLQGQIEANRDEINSTLVAQE